MKTMRLVQTARRGRVLCVSLCLAFPWLTSAQDPGLPGPVAAPPVRITSPANHAVFFTPVDIPIFAYVRMVDVTFTNVEFYAGTNDLGKGFDLGSATLPPSPIYANFIVSKSMATRLGSVYCLVWTNAPAGTYALTAVASGNEFLAPLLSRTSAPVNITILASTTNANPTDVVSIVATDPIAIAGTNASNGTGIVPLARINAKACSNKALPTPLLVWSGSTKSATMQIGTTWLKPRMAPLSSKTYISFFAIPLYPSGDRPQSQPSITSLG
jgi:hypothetical protein